MKMMKNFKSFFALAALAVVFAFSSCETIPTDDVTFINESGEDILVCSSNSLENANLTVEFAFSKKGESIWINEGESHTFPHFASTLFNDENSRCYNFIVIKKRNYDKYGKEYLIEKNRYDKKMTYSYRDLRDLGFRVVYKGR